MYKNIQYIKFLNNIINFLCSEQYYFHKFLGHVYVQYDFYSVQISYCGCLIWKRNFMRSPRVAIFFRKCSLFFSFLPHYYHSEGKKLIREGERVCFFVCIILSVYRIFKFALAISLFAQVILWCFQLKFALLYSLILG